MIFYQIFHRVLRKLKRKASFVLSNDNCQKLLNIIFYSYKVFGHVIMIKGFKSNLPSNIYSAHSTVRY